MKKIFITGLFFFGLITSTFSQSNSNSKPFTLQGKIIGEDSGRIILNYFGEYSKWIQDTVPIKNGEFVFKGNIIEPTKAQLIGGNDLNRVEIYLESGTMKIVIAKDKFGESKMTGSKAQLEFDLLNELERPLNMKYELLSGQRFKIDDSIKNTSIDSIKHKLEKSGEEIDKLLLQNREDFNPIRLQFVLDHPKSYVTPFFLDML